MEGSKKTVETNVIDMRKRLKEKQAESPDTIPGSPPLPDWLTYSAWGFSIGATLFYLGLYFVVPRYQQIMEQKAIVLPVFTRVLLNIYQTYLVILLLISFSILIIFLVNSRSRQRRYTLAYALIVVNFLIALSLFVISFGGLMQNV